MRTFGRVLAVLGVALGAIGAAGAIAMLPAPVLENAGSYVEERRQALRQHLPEMPELGGLIAGVSEPDCAAAAAGDAPVGTADCAADDPSADQSGLLFRSDEAASRFRTPAQGSADQ